MQDMWVQLNTPLGSLLLNASADGLQGAWFVGQRHFPKAVPTCILNEIPELHDGSDCGFSLGAGVVALSAAQAAVFAKAKVELAAYFAGTLQQFSVPLLPQGTVFQEQVWQQLCLVPYGETQTYGAVAAAIGRPKAVRAVGAAVGKNPLSVLIPCHRILGANGALTGYAGGLERKEYLLSLEQKGISPACL